MTRRRSYPSYGYTPDDSGIKNPKPPSGPSLLGRTQMEGKPLSAALAAEEAIRADERERIAAAIEAEAGDSHPASDWKAALSTAARIARDPEAQSKE